MTAGPGSRGAGTWLGASVALAMVAVLPLTAGAVQEGTRTLHVRVVDAASRVPIAGAEVVGPDEVAAVSDERGVVGWSLHGKTRPVLQVQAPGYLPRHVDTGVSGADGWVEVALERSPQFSEQLVVTGPASPPTEPVLEVTARTVAGTPGALEDGLQSLRALPGVVSRDDWSARLYVRGGRPDQNGIYLDGIPVYDPYRLFGLTSLFNAETLRTMTLYPGGFDARYGDRLSAVIAGENRTVTPVLPLAGSANVSLTGVNIQAEGRLGLGGPSSWLVSLRRTYYDLVVPGESLPTFADLQARLLVEPSPRHRLTATLVGARESTDAEVDRRDFDDVPDDHIEGRDEQRNLVLGVQGRHLLSERLRLGWVLSRTHDTQTSEVYFRAGETGWESWVDQDLDADTTTLRAWAESTLGRHTLELGGEAARSENRVTFHIDTEDPTLDIPDALRTFVSRQEYTRSGAFVQDTVALRPDLDLKLGVRHDRSDLSGMRTSSPRASLAWRPAGNLELHAAWGHYVQYPSFEALQGDGYFLDLRGIREARLRPEHAEHFVVGLGVTASRGWTLAVDLYDKPLRDLLASGKETETVLVLDEHEQARPYTRERRTFLPENRRSGYARGAQAVLTLLEGTHRPYWGILAYTFGQVRTRDASGWRWEGYDQRHSVMLVAGARLGPRLELSGKWHFASGFPYTPLRNVIRVVDDADGDGSYDPAAGDTVSYQRDEADATVNSRRLPPYHRLDVRLEYSPSWGGLDWSLYLDVINVYARANVESYSYNADFTRRKSNEGLPILPSLGFKLRF